MKQFGKIRLNNYFLIITELNCQIFNYLSKQLGHAKMRPGSKVLPLYKKEIIFYFLTNQQISANYLRKIHLSPYSKQSLIQLVDGL